MNSTNLSILAGLPSRKVKRFNCMIRTLGALSIVMCLDARICPRVGSQSPSRFSGDEMSLRASSMWRTRGWSISSGSVVKGCIVRDPLTPFFSIMLLRCPPKMSVIIDEGPAYSRRIWLRLCFPICSHSSSLAVLFIS